MNNRKLTDIATDLFDTMQKDHYKQTEDIREAIQFNYAKYVGYSADNCLYDDQPEDEQYIKLIGCRLRDMSIAIDTDSLILFEAESKQPIVVLPLSSISNINYLYFDNTCDLCFIFADYYLIDMTFNSIR